MNEIKRFDFSQYQEMMQTIFGKYCLYSEVEALPKRIKELEDLLKEKDEEIKSQRWALKNTYNVRDYWIKKYDELQSQLQQKDEEIDTLKKEKYIYEDWQLDTEPPHKINGKFIELKHYHELNKTLTSYRELMGRMVEYISKTSPYGEDSKLLTDYKKLEG